MNLSLLGAEIAPYPNKTSSLSKSTQQVGEPLSASLAMLFRAYQYSLETNSSRWQFAVEIDDLLRAGLSRSELRWLMATGLVIHACEILATSSRTRRFTGLGMHSFLRSSCFVLSDKAIEKLSAPRAEKPRLSILLRLPPGNHSPANHSPANSAQQIPGAAGLSLPEWNCERRELRLRGFLIKQFRGPAANQEWIIKALHEETWPTRIDDPLPPISDKDSRRRLNDAIKNLNRHQAHELIVFRGDGTGCGVLWELRAEALAEIELP
jgi:hypothetical protein